MYMYIRSCTPLLFWTHSFISSSSSHHIHNVSHFRILARVHFVEKMGGVFGKGTSRDASAPCRWCGGPIVGVRIGKLYPHLVEEIQNNFDYISYQYSVDPTKPKALIITLYVTVNIQMAYRVKFTNGEKGFEYLVGISWSEYVGVPVMQHTVSTRVRALVTKQGVWLIPYSAWIVHVLDPRTGERSRQYFD